MKNTKRVTIKDISTELNISLSTVNKALTGKSGVGEKRRKEVIEMAKVLGYRVNKVAQSLARNEIKIGIIIPNDWPQFYGCMEKGIRFELESLFDHNINGVFKYFSHKVKSIDDINICVDEMIAEKVDAVILCPAYYYNFQRTLKRFQESDIPVVLAGNDLPPYGNRLTSIRVDTNLAGSLAANIIKLFLPEDKSIAVFIGNKDVKVHKEKVQGFIDEINVNGSSTIGVYETQDDPELAHYLIKKLTNEISDLGAVYIATGNSSTICKYIYENNLTGKIKIVGTDVFEEMIEYMENGVVSAVIFQDAEKQGRLAVRTAYSYISEAKTPEKYILVSPQVILKSNIRLFFNN